MFSIAKLGYWQWILLNFNHPQIIHLLYLYAQTYFTLFYDKIILKNKKLLFFYLPVIKNAIRINKVFIAQQDNSFQLFML